jgi:hypothetical protein
MAENRHDTPGMPGITRFADHEVIVMPNRLKKAVRHAGANERDPVTDAETALVELSAQFGNWMEDECEALDKARQLVHAEGLNEQTRPTLFRDRLRSFDPQCPLNTRVWKGSTSA